MRGWFIFILSYYTQTEFLSIEIAMSGLYNKIKRYKRGVFLMKKKFLRIISLIMIFSILTSVAVFATSGDVDPAIKAKVSFF